MGGVSPDQARLTGRRQGEEVSTDVTRGQANRTQAGDHHMRQVLTNAPSQSERLKRVGCHVGGLRDKSNFAMYDAHPFNSRLPQGTTRLKCL